MGFHNVMHAPRMPSETEAFRKNLSHYLHLGAIFGRIRKSYEKGYVVLNRSDLNESWWSWMRVLLAWDFGNHEDSSCVHQLLKEQIGTSLDLQPVLVRKSNELNQEWVDDKAVRFWLWLPETDYFVERLKAFTRSNQVYFMDDPSVLSNVTKDPQQVVQQILQHTDAEVVGTFQWHVLLHGPSVHVQEENSCLWIPKNAFG